LDRIGSRKEWVLRREKTRASRGERTLSDQGIKPTTNRTHMWRQRRWDLNHIGGGGIESSLTTAPPLHTRLYEIGIVWRY